MAATKCDVKALTEIVDRCFDLAMDNRLTEAQCTKYLVAGKKLRGSLLNLISARFEEGTAELEEANEQLADVNAALKKDAEAIKNVADTVKSLSTLVGSLDKLLGVAESFI
jgi:hypothetical protein